MSLILGPNDGPFFELDLHVYRFFFFFLVFAYRSLLNNFTCKLKIILNFRRKSQKHNIEYTDNSISMFYCVLSNFYSLSLPFSPQISISSQYHVLYLIGSFPFFFLPFLQFYSLLTVSTNRKCMSFLENNNQQPGFLISRKKKKKQKLFKYC